MSSEPSASRVASLRPVPLERARAGRRGDLALRALGLAFAALLAPACAEDVDDGDQVSTVTVRVSTGFQDAQAAGDSFWPALSGDGRFVAFVSAASDLTPDDANGKADVFVKDRLTGQVENITNITTFGTSMEDCFFPTISADGRFVAFLSEGKYINENFFTTVTQSNVYVYDREQDVFRTVTLPGTPWHNGAVNWASISPGGRTLAFATLSTNLGYATGGFYQVMRCDFGAALNQRVITLVSHASGAPATAGNGLSSLCRISQDGTRVVFQSQATDLAAGDLDNGNDVYLWVEGAVPPVRLVSAGSPSGLNIQSNRPAISADGAVIAFVHSNSGALVPLSVQRYVVAGGAQVMASNPAHAFSFSERPGISGDGRFVVYTGAPAGAVVGDVWRFDATTSLIERLSVSSFGDIGNQTSGSPAISGDGVWSAWDSSASNLVRNDTNGWADVFVRGPSD